MLNPLYLQTYGFLLLGLLFLCVLRPTWLRRSLGVLWIVLFFMDLVSLLSLNRHINDTFWANFQLSAIPMMFSLFLRQTLIGLAFVVLVFSLYFVFERKIYAGFHAHVWNGGNARVKRLIYLGILGGLVFANVRPTSLPYSLYETFGHWGGISAVSQLETFKALGIDAQDLVTEENLTAHAGDNILIIYVESLNQEYFRMSDETGRPLMPYMNQLLADTSYWKFYSNYLCNDQAGWTTGAAFGTHTSLPPLFGYNGNNAIQEIDAKGSFFSIGTVFKKAGYRQEALFSGSSHEFGLGAAFKVFQYTVICSENIENRYLNESCGIWDADLFRKAKDGIREDHQQQRKFVRTLMTIDTHFPEGKQDPRFAHLAQLSPEKMFYSIRVLDSLLSDMLHFVRHQDSVSGTHTAVFVMPDHAVQGNAALTPVTKYFKEKEQKLFVLTNTSAGGKYQKLDTPLYFYDIPGMILSGAKIQTNAKFLPDYIPEFNGTYIERYRKELTNYVYGNMCSEPFDLWKGGVEIKFDKKGSLEVWSGHKLIYYQALGTFVKKIQLLLDKSGKKIFDCKVFTEDTAHFEPVGEGRFTILFTVLPDRSLLAVLADAGGKIYASDILKYGDQSIRWSPSLIRSVNAFHRMTQNHQDSTLNSLLLHLRSLNDKNLCVAIVVEDESSQLYDLFKNAFHQFGFKTRLGNKFRHSYIGVANAAGYSIKEICKARFIEKTIRCGKAELCLGSKAYDLNHPHFRTYILFNRRSYTTQISRGMNIVVFHKSGQIFGIYGVDTYDDPTLKTKRFY